MFPSRPAVSQPVAPCPGMSRRGAIWGRADDPKFDKYITIRLFIDTFIT